MFGPTPRSSERSKDRRRMWAGPVLAKYWALQLPATVLVCMVVIALGERLAWPLWIVWTMVAIWVAKDAMLYPFLWRAYDPGDPAALPYPVEGAQGVAIDRIDPCGRVRVWGELWRAELSRGARRIERGEAVQVKARLGLTLLIEPQG
jgi:membrane protein implicated in regulation of membrane protease activity